MDVETIFLVVAFLFWVLSSMGGVLKKMVSNRPQRTESSEDSEPGRRWQPVVPPPPPGGSSGEVPDAVRALMKQMGMEGVYQPPEAPVEGEHSYTPGEHSQAESELRGTPSEHAYSFGEHSQMAGETLFEAAEHRLSPGEHRGTLSEHIRGDRSTTIPPIVPAISSDRGRGRTGVRRRNPTLARAVRKDLFGGNHSLDRAYVLKEILGAPRALTPYGDGDRFQSSGGRGARGRAG